MVSVPISVLQRRLTLDDYITLPDDQDYEIICGVLYVSPSARAKHQIVANHFAFDLTGQIEHRALGIVVWDADLIVDAENTYVSPDLMVFLNPRADQIDRDDFIRLIPDLIVEVLSPSSRDYDQDTKRRTYERLRVPHSWIADPDRRLVRELVLGPDGRYAEHEVRAPDLFRPAFHPDLSVDLTRIFG